MGYIFLMFILVGAAFIVLFYLDDILRIIAYKGKKEYLIASVFDGYCLREIIVKAYNKEHAVEKIHDIKYIKEIRKLHYIPETKVNDILKIYALRGGVIV